LLKKAPNNTWVPIILGINIDAESSLETELFFWNILDIHMLLCYPMEEDVRRFFLFLTKLLWAGHPDFRSNTKDNPDISSIIKDFRSLDTPENKRHRGILREKAMFLTEHIENILSKTTSNPGNAYSSSKVIEMEFSKGPFAKHVDIKELETYILKVLASPQVYQILHRNYGLDMLLGKQMVEKNAAFMGHFNLEKPNVDDEQYIWEDWIFEGETDVQEVNPPSAEVEKSSGVFPDTFGYGNSNLKPNQVISLLGDSPLRYQFLDKVIHKPKYTFTDGCVIGFIMEDRLFQSVEDQQIVLSLGRWSVDVLRSPLSDEYKEWFLETTQFRHPIIRHR
jgi:hypothetical protein